MGALVAEGFQRLACAGPPMAAFRKMGEKLGIVEKPDPLEQVGVGWSLASFKPLTARARRVFARYVERTHAPVGEGVEEVRLYPVPLNTFFRRASANGTHGV